MKRLTFLFTMIVISTVSFGNGKNVLFDTSVTPIKDKHWKFEATPFWTDEFDKDGKPDSTKWSYDVGNNGWGNNELEYYTRENNASIKNGILTIEARKENVDTSHYTSARIVTKNKADFLYGRFEIRAKLAAGKGLWPAIWMLPTDWKYGDWPKSGEIDIMEQVGFDPQNIHISTHTENFNWVKNTQATKVVNIPTATTDFHVYRIDWTPYSIKGFIDSVQYFEFKNDGKGPADWPFDQKFHMILNVAIGGGWGGQKGVDDSIFPANMQVDYVRVYKMIDK